MNQVDCDRFSKTPHRLLVNGIDMGEVKHSCLISGPTTPSTIEFQTEPPRLEWKYGRMESPGLWAYSNSPEDQPPRIESGVGTFRSLTGMKRWWCYLGPIPAIATPKRMVEKQLWMIPVPVVGPHSAYYRELWIRKEDLCTTPGAIETQTFRLFEETVDEKSV